jgi:hypothetical protein
MYLPKNEFTFYCKVQGQKTKQWFEGNFIVKCCLTIEEQVQVAIDTDRLNQGSITIAPEYALLNRSLAEVNMRIVFDKDNKPQCPTWWTENRNGSKLMDSNVIFYIFSEAMKAEKDWADRLENDAKQTEKRAEASPVEAKAEAQG